MAGLTMVEKNLVDDLTGMNSGWVLNFSNATFEEFFRTEVGVNIYDEAYNFGSGSKGKRLRAFLEKAQPIAIAKALTVLWEYREDQRRREGKPESISDIRVRLSKIIERMGGASLSPSFDEISKNVDEKAHSNTRPTVEALQNLSLGFQKLHALAPQPRGYAFESFLKDFFNLWGMDAHRSFRNVGEQIDGSFWHSGATYLVEARWQNSFSDAGDLRSFQGKIDERNDWARGLFVSYAGFSSDGLQAFTARRIVLMDGYDIQIMLSHGIPLGDAIDAKARYSAERKIAFVRITELFGDKIR